MGKGLVYDHGSPKYWTVPIFEHRPESIIYLVYTWKARSMGFYTLE